MEKIKYNFKELKEMLKEDIEESIFVLFILIMFSYLIINSKIVLAFIISILSLLALITYRIYSGKHLKIKDKYKKYYDILGKSLFIVILIGFIIVFGVELYTEVIWLIKSPSWFTYFNIVVSSFVIILSLVSCYIVVNGKFNQNLFFSIFSLISIHEGIRQFIKMHIPSLISTLFMLTIFLFFIWSGAKINPQNDKTQP